MSRPKRGEVFWADLRPVKGSEQGGFRPVLILSNNIINQYSPVIMIAPLTRYVASDKIYPTDLVMESSDFIYIEDIETEVERLAKEGHLLDPNSDSKVYCDQARSISVKRLVKNLGKVTNSVILSAVTDKIAEVFAVTACNVCSTPMQPNQLKCGNHHCKKRHRIICKNCDEVIPLSFRYCSNCGKGART